MNPDTTEHIAQAPPQHTHTVKKSRCIGIREKLIGIFIAIKVLPLIALALFAARQIAELGNTFKENSNAIVNETKDLVHQTGNLATERSIVALDLKARESIERLSTDIAKAVADFLQDRDKDILLAANLPRNRGSTAVFLPSTKKA